MRYLFVFNPKAKRYSRKLEATVLEQAWRLFPQGTIAAAHTIAPPDASGPYVVPEIAHDARDLGCVVAVGGDGTVNIVIAAMLRYGLHTRIPLGVIPYGTGNNLVRSFGLERSAEKALLTIAQGHTIPLDVGLVNQRYYCVNASFGVFAHVLANRVTNSLLGYTYEAMRHLGVNPWLVRIRYLDAAERTIEIPAQRYLVGAMLNTAYYGSILHMAPDVVSDDGLFDVKLIRAVPRVAYPFMFTLMLTGQYALSSHTMTFRARQLELFLEERCRVETDGDVLPASTHYCIRAGGQVRLLVPSTYKPPGWMSMA